MIVQFGTSRFLQAHVDTFASEARDAGQSVPAIVIVQTTRDPVRARRLAAFGDPAGFPVIIRGSQAGVPVERTVQVRGIVGGLQAATDWPALVALVRDTATHIVSNTGDSGYRVDDADRMIADVDAAPVSFPAMLVALLYARWQAGGGGLTILPCELVRRNGDVLRGCVTTLAKDQRRDPAFLAWLDGDCIWANTLVDRIVSEPLEPAGAIAEPYALWAIETAPGLNMPFDHEALVLTDDLSRFERLKLHILNLSHSWLAERWQRDGSPEEKTVRAALDDPATRAALDRLLDEEVVPGFALHGMAAEARTYAATTIDRLTNPFLDHRLADIHADHAAKIDKRLGGFVRWVEEAGGPTPAMTELRTITHHQAVFA